MTVVSLSLPDELVERLDEYADEHEYSARSEVVRECVRVLLDVDESPADSGGRCVWVAMVLFEHGERVAAELSRVRHRHDDLVARREHRHATGSCLEIFVLNGPPAELESFLDRLRAVDGAVTLVGPRHTLPDATRRTEEVPSRVAND